MSDKFTNRSYQSELLDEPNIPKQLLFQNLRELDFINKTLGGHAITIAGIKQLVTDKNKTYHIVDIGCGGGDAMKYIADWAQKNNYKIKLTGVDMNADAIEYMKNNCSGYSEINSEYIEVPLSAPLIANRKYCLSFYVSLSAKYWLATSNIGAYFSTDSLLFVSYSPNVIDSVIPQIDNPSSNILNDTANWMLVSGSFIAAGGEKFMTIGNFHDSINATFQSLPWGQGDAAYYYFDDFSMVDCTNVGINERTGEEIISIYPNPATTSISITSTNNIKEIKLINLLGEEVIVRNYELGISPSTPLRVTDAVSVDISSASKGIYFVEITDVKENVINRKVVVQ